LTFLNLWNTNKIWHNFQINKSDYKKLVWVMSTCGWSQISSSTRGQSNLTFSVASVTLWWVGVKVLKDKLIVGYKNSESLGFRDDYLHWW